MGSNVQYSLMSGFKAVNAWQQLLARNAQGLLQAGFNRSTMHFNGSAGGTLDSAQIGSGQQGGRNARWGSNDTLMVGTSTLNFEQGELHTADSPTSLAIRGDGFFIVAENLGPGARLFLTRNGDFHYDPQGRLVNSQGLFVVGGNGALSDPPAPVTNPGDGSVVLGQLTLGKVAVPSQLTTSAYGQLIYALTPSAGPLQALANGRPEVGFVQANTLEFPSRAGQLASLQVENTYAQQTYKMFKDFLDNYNRSTDDAISVVK